MRIKHLIYILFISLVNSYAQEADTKKQISYIKLGAANDLFQNRQKSDKYFSAAFQAQYANQIFNNPIAEKVLLASPKHYSTYALSLQQNGFTPEDLTKSEIDSTDRPYAGTLTLSYIQSSFITDRNWKYTTAFRFGFSGPIAMVEKTQKGIHKATGGTIPQGWDNQIGNSLILQYAVNGEKQFLTGFKHIRLGLGAYAEVGSFYNHAVPYGNLMIGWFHQKFQSIRSVNFSENRDMRKWQLYANFYISNRIVLYDGSLQGGLIPFEESPHTFTWSEYKHNTPQFTFTITASYKNIQLQYWNVATIDPFFLDELFSFGSIGLYMPIGN